MFNVFRTDVQKEAPPAHAHPAEVLAAATCARLPPDEHEVVEAAVEEVDEAVQVPAGVDVDELPALPPIDVAEESVDVALTDVGELVASLLAAARAAEGAAVAAAESTKISHETKLDALQDAIRQASGACAQGVRDAYSKTLQDVASTTREHAVSAARLSVEAAIRTFESRATASLVKAVASQVDTLVENALTKHLEAAAGPMLEAAVQKHLAPALEGLSQRVAVAAASAVREASGQATPAALGALAVASDVDVQLENLLKTPLPKSAPVAAPAPTTAPAPAGCASSAPVNGLSGSGRVRRQRD